MKYKKLTGIVLKKQNYREADQIITIFTKELGKVRVMARGLRKPGSKLAYSMQDLALVEIEMVKSNIPSLISARPLAQFIGVRESLTALAAAFYASELLLKTTPDENPSPEVYDLILEYLKFLENNPKESDFTAYAFALKLMSCIGFSIERAEEGFLTPQLRAPLQQMQASAFGQIAESELAVPASKIKKAVRDFTQFVLERNLKSEPFLIEHARR